MSRLLGIWTCALTSLLASAAAAQVQWEVPKVAQGIGVEQRLGESLPLALTFHDDHNNFVKLGDYFGKARPVLLSFNYSNCPQLCVVQLNNLVAALNVIDLVPGRDFEIVSVSLDPTEQTTTLSETKMKYLASYGKMDTEGGWHFLKGSKPNIVALADASGFTYKYIPEQRLYSHPSAFIFCSPDGRIMRYLDGLNGDLSATLKPALIEAGEGKVGSILDKVVYFSGCFYYDPSTGKYGWAAMGIMRIAGAATVLILIITVTPYWWRRRAGHAKVPPKQTSDFEQQISAF